ncbi:hypothetical protein HBB16_06160 [Pseudonocardia sp. MCCB 268]|nr:hypothetical protein [Pseudonocardia cytotoxica]
MIGDPARDGRIRPVPCRRVDQSIHGRAQARDLRRGAGQVYRHLERERRELTNGRAVPPSRPDAGTHGIAGRQSGTGRWLRRVQHGSSLTTPGARPVRRGSHQLRRAPGSRVLHAGTDPGCDESAARRQRRCVIVTLEG